MSLQCPCNIVFTPTGGAALTLAAVGNWLAGHPVWKGEQALYETAGVLAANAHFSPLGGAAVTLTFTVESTLSTRLAAQSAVLDAALPAAGVLVISSPAGTATYPSAAIAAIGPGLPAGPEHVASLAYTIRAALPALSAAPS